MIIAQLSDLHVRPRGMDAYGGVDTNAMFESALAAVRTLRPQPDCVMVSGDLTDCGLPEEYEVLREGLGALPMPVYVIPGNHDRRKTLQRMLSPCCDYLPRSGFVHYAVDRFPVRLIALDTVEAGRTWGSFCAERQGWLAHTLADGNGKPTLIAMHHPPFPVGVEGMDELGLHDAPAFEAIVRRHPEVERIVCGHYHRPITVRYAGTVGFAMPSSAHQVALDLETGHPSRFVMEPPAIAVHTWRHDTGLVTHLVPIGDFGTPFDIVVAREYPGQAAHA